MDVWWRAISEAEPGPRWAGLFAELWPAYRRWWLREGADARPTYLQCFRALRQHMPELLPLYEKLCDLAGGGDLAARFLSFYRPPPYLSGCSQAIWPGAEPVLVRNYDYDPHAFESVVLHSAWDGRRVMGTSDGLWGLVDGMNDAGLALSLTFGGRRVVGDGFGVPLIEAMARRLPVVAYASSAVPETVDGAALLLPVKDPATVSTALDRVLGSPELAASLAAAGSRRAEAFSADRAVDAFLAALELLDAVTSEDAL